MVSAETGKRRASGSDDPCSMPQEWVGGTSRGRFTRLLSCVQIACGFLGLAELPAFGLQPSLLLGRHRGMEPTWDVPPESAT
jgi:hypothetical protein